MEAIYWIMPVWGLVGVIAWLYILAGTARALFSTPFLPLKPPPPEQDWPRLSLVVPACNEEESFESAGRTLLQQDYPNLEIIFVNDRSSDATPHIMQRLAEEDKRVRVVNITDLPAGWLGKVHALHTGLQQATGEWFLFSDADVHSKPDTLRRAVAYAREHNLDHVAAIPRLFSASFSLKVLSAAFALLLMFILGRTQRRGSASGFGVGAFNLVRRSAFERTQGFSWLRMEVVDDFGLATMLVRAGARSRAVFGMDALGLAWYPGAAAMIRGLEKNSFGLLARYSWRRAVLSVLALCLFALAPVAALGSIGLPVVQAAGALIIALLLAASAIAKLRFKQESASTLFIPLGLLVIAWTLLRSTWAAWRNGGIRWRGTLYPLAALREGQRINSG